VFRTETQTVNKQTLMTYEDTKANSHTTFVINVTFSPDTLTLVYNIHNQLSLYSGFHTFSMLTRQNVIIGIFDSITQEARLVKYYFKSPDVVVFACVKH
jgi:hypothetical protein